MRWRRFWSGLGTRSVNPASPLDRLEQPEESLERLASREMDLREALEEAPAWKRGLYTAFTGGEETLTDAIG